MSSVSNSNRDAEAHGARAGASTGAASAGAGAGAAASAASGHGAASGAASGRGRETRFVAERATLSGARVLDVGCGGGLLAESLARAGAKVTAIDLAPGMIEVARLHAMEQKLEIDYRMVAAESVAAAEPGSRGDAAAADR